MRKQRSQSCQSTGNVGEGQSRRRRVRSCPRLEQLEGRIVMSTFQVNTTLDTVAVDLRTGKDATGHISLRSAIMAADARGGSNTINLPSGTYTLTIAGANEDASATGDLDITSNLTIKGAGSGSTIIDGNNLDRVIQVLQGKTTISGVTIQHGLANMGGGLLNSGGQVTLSSVVVTANRAVGSNGGTGVPGLSSHGGNGTDGGNGGDGTAGLGGGIFNGAGSLSISNSTISANQAIGGDGGQGGDGGFGVFLDQPAGNGQSAFGGKGGSGGAGAAARGGGIYNAAGAALTLSGTSVSSNVVTGGQGGQGGAAGFSAGGAGGPVTSTTPRNSGDGTGGAGAPGARADREKVVACTTSALPRSRDRRIHSI